jgi:hypothetical protein
MFVEQDTFRAVQSAQVEEAPAYQRDVAPEFSSFIPSGANSTRSELSFVGQVSWFQVQGLFQRRFPSG